MNITIHDDFWSNVQTYRNLIRRICWQLFDRWPNPEGLQDTFHYVLLKLEEINVFKTFNANRYTDKIVGKRFEQYIYTKIDGILSHFNYKRRRYAFRFKSGEAFESVERYTPSRLKTWAASQHTWDSEKPCIRKSPNNRKKYPCVDDSHEYINPESTESAHSFEGKEFQEKFIRILKAPLEKKILEMLLLGYSSKEIAQVCGRTPGVICKTLKGIRAKYREYERSSYSF